MSETETLPAHPNLDWYKKSAKKRLAELRAGNPAQNSSMLSSL